MTDIEKKTYKVTLIRGAAICMSLIACTWKLSGSFNEFSNEFNGLKHSINVMVINMNDLSKRDSIKTIQLEQLTLANAQQEHDIDSLKKVARLLAIKAHMKMGISYYTERRVNGKIITEELN